MTHRASEKSCVSCITGSTSLQLSAVSRGPTANASGLELSISPLSAPSCLYQAFGSSSQHATHSGKSRRLLQGALGSAGAQAPCWRAGLSPAPHQLPEGGSTYAQRKRGSLSSCVATAVVGTTTGSPLGEAAEMAAPTPMGRSPSLTYGAAELADSTSQPTSRDAHRSNSNLYLSSDSQSESD